MLVDLLCFFTVIYILLILLFTIAGLAARYPSDLTFKPRVSIIIAARNEEKHIEDCLDSLSHLTYPIELLEIIIIDDRSTDATSEIVSNYAEKLSNLHLIHVLPEAGRVPGKMNAVTQAIDVSSGEILLFTDADCRVKPAWVENSVKYYTDPAIGLVAGFTSLRGERLFERMQALDWFVLSSVAAATTKIRFPVTAVGTNLTVRRKAYDAVGGYRNIPFSVTEDYALFHAVTTSGKYRARIPMDEETLVESEPCRDWGHLFSQKKRWFTGGRGMDAKSLAVFAFPYLFNMLLLVSAICSLGSVMWWALGIKLVVDFFLCIPAPATFKRFSLLLSYPAYELYYYIYVLLFPPLVLFGRKVTWKETTFTK